MNEWDRRADEPALCYERFIDFCALGPRRSLRALWAAHRLTHPDDARKHPPKEWAALRARFAWDARAAAWDSRRLALSLEQHRRAAGRRRRLAIARRGVEQALLVIDAALQEELGVREARALLPMARQLLRDMLAVERDEARDEAQEAAHEAAHEGAAEGGPAAFGAAAAPLWAADALAAAEQAAAELAAAQQAAAQQAAAQTASAHAPPLLLCTGSDPALEIDVAQLRRVYAATGLDFHHLPAATRDDLATALTRARSLGHPIRYLHLACHASHAGIELHDGVADGAWLSRTLAGLEVVLIAGCYGDRVGDWLGGVPYVVTAADALEHGEAAALTLHFWRGIGEGLTPGAALARALDACPPAVRESVVAHW